MAAAISEAEERGEEVTELMVEERVSEMVEKSMMFLISGRLFAMDCTPSVAVVVAAACVACDVADDTSAAVFVAADAGMDANDLPKKEPS